MRRMVATLTLALVLILPVAASRQTDGNVVAAAASSPPGACAPDGSRQFTTVNPDYVWRLRAYEDLDCALAILDDALKTSEGVVVLSRQQAEQARASVWSARDAAARIGR